LAVLRREGLCVNHKRVYRIYQLNGLSVKRRRRRKGLATERLPLLRPMAPNLTWSMDFVMDALATGRRIKCLTCVDDFTKECLTVTVAFRDFRRSGHAYSGQHCAVSRLSGDDKN
jgi:putative transposase